MIRLGGTIEGVLARLGEKTLEMVEGVPIEWMSGTNIEEKILGFLSGNKAVLEMVANFDSVRKEGFVELIAQNGAEALTTLQVLASEEVSRITLTGGGASRTLIDFLTGSSSFMQRYSGGSSAFGTNRINWGVATLTWSASKKSAKVKINHGLGELEPTGIFLQILDALGPFEGTSLDANLIAKSKTQIEIAGTCSESLTTSFTCFWVAMA